MNEMKETRRTLDYVWERLIGKLVPNAGNRFGNPLVGFPLVITQPLTIYVETWGDDNGSDGGSSPLKPFRTVQAALDWLRPFVIQASVVVQIGPGTFDGFETPDLNVSPGPGIVPTLTIQGTLSVYATGTATSGSAGVLNDTTRTWAVDELKDKLILMGTSTNKSWIHDNTATSLRTIGNINPTAGSSYTIYELATHIAVNKNRSGINLGTTSVGIWSTDQRMGVGSSVPYVLHKNLEVGSTVTGSGYCVQSHGGAFTAAECKFTIAGTVTLGVNQIGSGPVSMNRCLFAISNTTGVGIATYGSVQTFAGSWIYATSPASTRGMSFLGGQQVQFSACLIENVGIGASASVSTAGIFGNLMGTFVGNTVAIQVDAPSAFTLRDSTSNLPGFPFTSSGNGTFLKVNHPSTVGVGSTVPVAPATTDIDLHGVTSTLANMRTTGVWPTTPTALGSKVYAF